MQYKKGLVTVTNGSAIVVGNAATDWVARFPSGTVSNSLFAIPNQAGTYYVDHINVDGNLVLTAPWAGDSLTLSSYWLTVDFTPIMGFPIAQPGDVDATRVIEKALVMIDQALDLKPAGLYAVLSATTTAPPASPAPGASYIVPTGATGAWASYVGKIAVYRKSAWMFYAPTNGMFIKIADEGAYRFWNADTSAWEINPIISSGVGVTLRDTVMTDQYLTYWDQASGKIKTSGSNTLSSLTTSIANRLRVDAVQGLTSGQKTQAQNNLGLLLNTDVQAHAARLDSIVASGIDTTMFATNTVDDDVTLGANSASRIPTQHAVNMAIQAAIQGLKWKTPVQLVATTAQVSGGVLSGEKTIDGTLTSGSRVLLTADGTFNGIWVTSAGAWTRATDADIGSELVNATTLVESGTANQRTTWTSTNTAITLGTTSITFVQAGSVTISPGTGIAMAGSVVSVATNGITYALMQQVAASSLIGNATGALANATGITLGATLGFSGASIQTVAHTGDVTSAANSFALTVSKIAGVTVSGVTGTGKVVFDTAPQVTSLGIGGAISTQKFAIYGAGASTPSTNTNGIKFFDTANSNKTSQITGYNDGIQYSCGNTGSGHIWYNGDTVKMQLDTSGYLLTPGQIRFHAGLSGNTAWVGSAYNTFNPNVVAFNVGGGYSNSNGTFTAPVAGKYHFGYCIGSEDSSTGMECLVRFTTSIGTYDSYWTFNHDSSHWYRSGAIEINLAAGQTVNVTTWVGSTGSWRSGSYFYGHLLG